MIKRFTLSLSKSFSIQPNRANRFFTLTLNLNKQIPLAQTLKQAHQKHLKQYEKQEAVLLVVKNSSINKFVYFLQSNNQIQPFKFYKKNPLYTHNLVDNYKIQQIQMKSRVRDKELAPNYLRQ